MFIDILLPIYKGIIVAIKFPKCHTGNPSDSKYCNECATLLAASEEITSSLAKTLEAPEEELTTGSTFAGRYQIAEELGKGGMVDVYKANDTKINEKIAIKLIKPEIEDVRRRLSRL